jgi:hypothetical protein
MPGRTLSRVNAAMNRYHIKYPTIKRHGGACSKSQLAFSNRRTLLCKKENDVIHVSIEITILFANAKMETIDSIIRIFPVKRLFPRSRTCSKTTNYDALEYIMPHSDNNFSYPRFFVCLLMMAKIKTDK